MFQFLNFPIQIEVENGDCFFLTNKWHSTYVYNKQIKSLNYKKKKYGSSKNWKFLAFKNCQNAYLTLHSPKLVVWPIKHSPSQSQTNQLIHNSHSINFTHNHLPAFNNTTSNFQSEKKTKKNSIKKSKREKLTISRSCK